MTDGINMMKESVLHFYHNLSNVGFISLCLTCIILLIIIYKQLFPDAKTKEKFILNSKINYLCDNILKGDPSDWDDFEDKPHIREKAIVNMAVKNGNTFTMHCRGYVADALGSNKIIATCEPTLIKELFLNKIHTIKRPERYRLAQFLPGLDGVLFQDGERWKTHSRALIPVFHASNFNQYSSFMNEAAFVHVMHKSWPNEVKKDLLKSIRQLATTIVLAAGYGVDPLEEEGQELRFAINSYDEKARFRWAGKNPFKLIFALGWVWWDAQRIKKAVKMIVNNRKNNKVDSTKSNNDDDVSDKKPWNSNKTLNWIDRMIEFKFSIKDIFNEVNHLHAAHKAIAIIITFALYELGLTKNKKWQDKLRNELKSKFGTTKGTFPNKESIKNLPITMAIWKETLRMHPISLGVLRETGKDIETTVFVDNNKEDKGKIIILPKGTPIQILLQALHFHPKYWKKPEEFNPNRWIDADDTSQRSTASDLKFKNVFVPFLDGQRQCQGRFLAELEFIIVLNSIILNYEIEVPSTYKFMLKPDFYPEMINEIPLIVKKL